MTTLVDLVFRASTDQLEKAQDKLKQVAQESKKANGETDALKSAFEGMSNTARMGAGAVLAVATAAGVAYAAYTKLRDAAIEAADKMNDLANRSNVAASRLSLLDVMARMAGSSAEELVVSAERLGSKLARQDEESGRAATALKDLGVKTREANGEQKSMLQLQEEIILAVGNSANAAKAEGAAVQLLGNEYYKLRTVVKEAADSKGEMYDYMLKTNALISTSLAKNSDDYNDKVAKLAQAFKGVGNSLAEWALPGMIRFVEWATRASEAVASLTRRLTGGSTNTEKADSTVSDLQTRLDRAQRKRAAMDPSASGPLVDNADALIASLQAQLTAALRSASTAREVDSANRDGVLGGKSGEGNSPAGRAGKDKAEKDPHLDYAAVYKKQQEALADFYKGQEDLDKLTAQYAARVQKVVDAEEDRAKAAERSVEENRVQIAAMAKFGATQSDVTLALLDYNIAQTQAALLTAESVNSTSDEVTILRKKLEVLQRIKTTEGEKNADNQAEQARQSTFEYGWKKAFDNYVKDASDAAKTGEQVFSSVSGHMGDALADFVMTGKMNFKDLTRSILADLAKIMAQKAIAGIAGNLFGGLFANGGAFAGGVQMFADGGVVGGPMAFGMAGGRMGVMGEAGPEAIMPLSRGADGKLGVRAQAAGNSSPVVHNTMTVHIGTVDSEARKQDLLKAIHDQMVATSKATIAGEMRQGGILNRRYATA